MNLDLETGHNLLDVSSTQCAFKDIPPKYSIKYGSMIHREVWLVFKFRPTNQNSGMYNFIWNILQISNFTAEIYNFTLFYQVKLQSHNCSLYDPVFYQLLYYCNTGSHDPMFTVCPILLILNKVSKYFARHIFCISYSLIDFSEKNSVNPLQPGVAFLYPLKTSENLKVFWCFQGV